MNFKIGKKSLTRISLVLMLILFLVVLIIVPSSTKSDYSDIRVSLEDPKISDDHWSRKITVYHEDDETYHNVPVSMTIPEDLIEIELHRYLNPNLMKRVTYDPAYDFQVIDSDDNGLTDIVKWIIPELSEASFSVEGKLVEDILPIKEFAMEDSRKKAIKSVIRLRDSTTKNLIRTLSTDIEIMIDAGEYDIEIIPENHSIKNIYFRNVRLNETVEELVDLDDVPESIPTPEEVKEWTEVYAIDPAKLDFTEAEVTVTAKGNILYKCKDWNFVEQSCYGSWIKLMDIIPGQDYTFNLTREDPGFGEVNITNAMHLDSSYNFISNIYDEVKGKDNVWSEPINDSHFVRAYYEKNLTNRNVIDAYVRNPNLDNTTFVVYSIDDTNTTLGNSGVIDSADGEWVHIKLANVSEPRDVFDFKIIGENADSYLEFDYIHDAPPQRCYVAHGALVSGVPWEGKQLYNSTYVINDNTNGVKTEFKLDSRGYSCDEDWRALPSGSYVSYFFMHKNYSVDTEISGDADGKIYVDVGCKDKKSDGQFYVNVSEYNPNTQTFVHDFGGAVLECGTGDAQNQVNITGVSAHTVSAGNKMVLKVFARTESCPDTDFEYKIKINEYKAGGGAAETMVSTLCGGLGDSGTDFKSWAAVVWNEEEVVADNTPPTWSNPDVNVTDPSRGDPVNISVVWEDSGGADFAWLATNETGSWKNYTDGTYDSPRDLGDTTSLITVNFTWTNQTGSPRVIGWIIYANDTSGNENGTDNPSGTYEGNFTMWGWSNITWTSGGGSANVGDTVKLTCFVNDTNTTGSGPIANYTVNFYNETDSASSLLGTNSTNSSGHAVYYWDTTGLTGTYYPKCNITDNSTLYYNASEYYEANTTVTISACSVAIGLSNTLADGITFGSMIQGQTNDASGNNGASASDYYIEVQISGCSPNQVDIYMKANDFTNGSYTIDVSNEKFRNSTTNTVLASLTNVSLSTSWAVVGDDLSDTEIIYLKYLLTIPSSKQAGIYNNTVNIWGGRNDLSPS